MAQRPDTFARWSLEMRRAQLFRAGERVGVAVSGGADSVLLLDFMKQLAGKMGLSIAAIHFNHHLRGAESDADERFVRERARDYGVEFIRGGADVAKVAREKHCNLEATARDLRYRFFFSLVNQRKLDKVATAHTADDQAETVLLRLLRGTGTRGLGGIYPVLEGGVTRPLLNLTRAEIKAELGRRGLAFRVDSSNQNTRFLRNKVRSELLPWLRKEFNPGIISLLKELADRARDEEGYLEQQAWERARAWRVREGRNEKIPVRPLIQFPRAIARRVLRQMVMTARGSLRGVTHGHIEALRRFAATAQSGRALELPGLAVQKEFDWLVIGPQRPDPDESGFSYSVEVPGAVPVPELGVTFQFEIVDSAESPREYNSSGRGCLDPEKLGGSLVLRSWRAGDRFRPSGSRRARRVKELFGQHRIPVGQRKLWPVLECSGEIIWVRGFPPAAAVVASPGSRRTLIIVEEPLTEA